MLRVGMLRVSLRRRRGLMELALFTQCSIHLELVSILGMQRSLNKHVECLQD